MTARAQRTRIAEIWIDYQSGALDDEDLEQELDDVYRVPLSPEERVAFDARMAAEKQAAREEQVRIQALNARVQALWHDEWRRSCDLPKKHERQQLRRELRARLEAVL